MIPEDINRWITLDIISKMSMEIADKGTGRICQEFPQSLWMILGGISEEFYKELLGQPHLVRKISYTISEGIPTKIPDRRGISGNNSCWNKQKPRRNSQENHRFNFQKNIF